jgi:hypothetical protein
MMPGMVHCTIGQYASARIGGWRAAGLAFRVVGQGLGTLVGGDRDRIDITRETPMDTPARHMLPTGTRRLLNRRVERALRHCFGADVTLRDTVEQIVHEMHSAGVPRDDIRAILSHAVQAHGRRQALDRLSVITGLPTSEVLVRQVIEWVNTVFRVGDESSDERASAAS